MNFRRLGAGFGQAILSLVCGGVFYSVWLSVFLLTAKSGNPVAEVILWPLAPMVTAAGFAAGVMIFEHLAKRDRSGFFGIFIWPLAGCAIGSLAVCSFGPMLIVFGMLAAGTASIALREVILSIRRARHIRIKA